MEKREFIEGKSQSGMVNVFKLICAVLVVMIHSSAFMSLSEEAFIITSLGITRVAVPFFFIVNGYFNYKHIYNKNKWGELVKKYFKLYFLWCIIEMVFLLPTVFMYFKMNPVWAVAKILVSGVTSSLWYLLGLAISMWIVGKLVRGDKWKTLIVISIVLFALGLAGESYYKFFEGTFINNITMVYRTVFVSMPFVVGMGVPMLTVGIYLKKNKVVEKFKSSLLPGLLMVVSIAVLCIEAYVLYTNKIAVEYNFYISILLAASFIFIFAMKSKACISSKVSKLCSELSLGIYLVHQIIMLWVMTFYRGIVGPENMNTLVVFSVTIVIATLVAIMITRVKGLKKLIMK